MNPTPEHHEALSAAEPIVERLHRLAAVGKSATGEDLAELRQMMEEEQREFVEWVEQTPPLRSAVGRLQGKRSALPRTSPRGDFLPSRRFPLGHKTLRSVDNCKV